MIFVDFEKSFFLVIEIDYRRLILWSRGLLEGTVRAVLKQMRRNVQVRCLWFTLQRYVALCARAPPMDNL